MLNSSTIHTPVGRWIAVWRVGVVADAEYPRDVIFILKDLDGITFSHCYSITAWDAGAHKIHCEVYLHSPGEHRRTHPQYNQQNCKFGFHGCNLLLNNPPANKPMPKRVRVVGSATPLIVTLVVTIVAVSL